MTPNIQIGTVTQGTSFNVTRTGTNENPVLNFTLVKGDKGDRGIQGIQGLTGNGISSITKTGTSGLVDTYTITYTNGNTTTFTITNGEDGEVTETELNVLRQKVEDQQKVINQLPQVTGQGTSITLENTIEAPFTKFDVEGNTRQSNLPAEYTQLDYITSDGNAFIDAGIILGKNYKVDVDFVNNVVRNVEQPIVSIWTTSSNWWNLFIDSSGVLDFYAKGHNYLGEVAIGEKQKLNIIRDNNKIMVIKNGESFPISVNDTEVNNTTLKLFKRGDNQGDSRISILATSVYDNNILVRNFIPCKNSNNVIGMYDLANGVFYANAGTGTFTAGDASLPTPENLISIKNTGDSGSINEKIQNKNIISSENIDATFMGVKYLSQDNGTILANGKKYGGAYFNLTDTIVTLENETYSSKVFLLNGSISRDGTNIHSIVYLINQADTSKSYNIGEIGNPGKSQLIEAGTYYLRIATWEDNTIFANAEIGIMLVKGSTIPTAYVPHEEQNISLTLPEGMKLCKIGDNADYFYKEDGKWYKYEVIKKIVLTGNENWIYYTNVGEPYFFYTPDYTNIIKNKIVDNSIILCNYFQNRGKTYKPSGQGIFVNANSSGKIENGNLSVTTYNWGNDVETFKQFLREKKPEVYFAVKEPTEIEITDETLIAQLEAMQALRTYKNVTHINSEDETKAYLEVSGIYDLNKLINN